MSEIDKALEIAVNSHKGQTDKYGQPYILHPLRVMMRQVSENARIVAILHDVVEDCNVSLDDLKRNGFSEEIVTAIDHISRREGEDYGDYIKRLSGNPITVKVKIADLEDNMDIRRMDNVSEHDIMRLGKYLAAWKFLMGVMRNY